VQKILGDVKFDFLVEEAGRGGQILPNIFWSGGGNYAGPSCSKVDSAIQLLNNWGQVDKKVVFGFAKWHGSVVLCFWRVRTLYFWRYGVVGEEKIA